MSISIEGLDKAAVLAALYNGSKVQGLGFLQANDDEMTVDEARDLLRNTTSFDYLHGRVMKINLSFDTDLDTSGYDRDNGAGAAEQIISVLRFTDNVNAEEIETAHLEGTHKAAIDVKENMKNPITYEDIDGVHVINLTLKLYADILKPIIDEIIGDESDNELS